MKSTLRTQLGFLFILVVLFFMALLGRLVQLQLLGNPHLTQLAKRQFQKTTKDDPYRLPILDRNGEELAVTMKAGSVFARPKLVRQKMKAARLLSKTLGGSRESWVRKLKSNRPFVWIKRQISAKKAEEIKNAGIQGLFVEAENKRIYPNGSLAAHVLGFTNIDGKGLVGIERFLDKEIRTTGSSQSFLRDGKGNRAYFDKSMKTVSLEDRKGIYVTLDRRIQYILEDELERTFKETGAKAVLSLVMDPATGEVLAMGQRPTFDPNHFRNTPSFLFTNRMISHLYEPGSTFKVLLGVEALDYGLINERTEINGEGGQITIGKTVIRESSEHHRFDEIVLEDIIKYSSNVGAVKVAQLLGADRIRGALRKFGFLDRTGISLPGEVAGSSRDAKVWTPLRIANVGFGQGIAVTPLQMASAFGSIANGGYLVRPRILLREVGIESEARVGVKRVLSTRSAQSMRNMLVSVTEGKGGTGSSARVKGIRVAGKTGTAQKYESGKGYNTGKYFSSFIGFLPADQPQLLIAVMVDEPKDSYYASQVATPMFRRVATRTLQLLDKHSKKPLARVVPLRQTTSTELEPRQVQLTYRNDGKFLMPSFKGLSLREFMRNSTQHFDRIKVEGTGFLVGQSPPAGVIVERNTPISLKFSPS